MDTATTTRTFTARYSGRCAHGCERGIIAGDPIARTPNGYAHTARTFRASRGSGYCYTAAEWTAELARMDAAHYAARAAQVHAPDTFPRLSTDLSPRDALREYDHYSNPRTMDSMSDLARHEQNMRRAGALVSLVEMLTAARF